MGWRAATFLVFCIRLRFLVFYRPSIHFSRRNAQAKFACLETQTCSLWNYFITLHFSEQLTNTFLCRMGRCGHGCNFIGRGHRSLGVDSPHTKQDPIANICDPSTLEVKTRGLEVQGHLQFHSEYQPELRETFFSQTNQIEQNQTEPKQQPQQSLLVVMEPPA